jgi:hypothetical protein
MTCTSAVVRLWLPCVANILSMMGNKQGSGFGLS